MGGSPATSAANPTGETWDVRDLVVADGSAFPTASGVNPMITIEAIAHLNATSPGGEPQLDRRGGANVETAGRLLADRALVLAAQQHLELGCGGLGLADHDLRSRREALVVEPVQKLAVVLCEPDDLRLLPDFRGR